MSQRVRRLLITAMILAFTLAAFIGVNATHAASYCTVKYSITNQWAGGFGGSIAIQNTSSSNWTSWALGFTFPATGQAITQSWSSTYTQSGQNVTINGAAYNNAVAVNATVTLGFNANWTTSNPIPTSFTVNGNICNGSTPPTIVPTTVPTTPPGSTPTTVPTVVPTTPPTAIPPTPIPGSHLDNAFVGAKWYINPDYASEVKTAAAAKGGTLGAQMAQVANYNTAVWLDRIAAVAGGPGVTRTLQGHLDAAVAQGANLILLVIYDLPDRDCAALASNGELTVANNGLATYKSQYIDPIASLLSSPKYSGLRIVNIIEPDSLPNLITNLSFAKCAEANSSGAYVQGVQYALNKLHAINNVYNYLDVGHSGWLGWSSNFQPTVNLLTSTIKGTTAGVNSVDGFISATANYTPTTEPYMTANQQVGGNPVRSANFYQWNQYIDEGTYDTDLRTAFIAAGFPTSIGMLIDTSRNGWGGSGPQGTRPTAASTSPDLNTFVNASKIDRRVNRGNWCNQFGGIGVRPTANPAPGFDAYVWVKPPGESDGSSQPIVNNEGKGTDPMCDPTFHGSQIANGGNLTQAMPNAPLAGHWFEAAFEMLVQNAYPAFN